MYEPVSGDFARELRLQRNLGIVFFNRIVNTENKARRWQMSPGLERNSTWQCK